MDSSGTKVVLVNTVTRDMLDIALLKRNHPNDYIVSGSILLSQSEEESKTYDSQSLTVHFITRQFEEGIYRKYYNQVVISA